MPWVAEASRGADTDETRVVSPAVGQGRPQSGLWLVLRSKGYY